MVYVKHGLVHAFSGFVSLKIQKLEVVPLIMLQDFYIVFWYHCSFQTLKNGDHTLLREFSFINLTPYNRACFVKLFYTSFVNIGKKGGELRGLCIQMTFISFLWTLCFYLWLVDLLSIRDYFSLVSILCNDFPYEILQKTAKIVLIEDAHDCLISFTDFLYAFQLQLYYQGEWAIEIHDIAIRTSGSLEKFAHLKNSFYRIFGVISSDISSTAGIAGAKLQRYLCTNWSFVWT